MISADDGSLQETPYVFHAVGMHVSPNVLPFAVIDRFMLGVRIRYAFVGFPFVSVDSLNISGDVLTNKAVQSFAVSAFNHLQDDVAAALDGPDHDGLVARISASLAFSLAAYEGLIGLYNA